MNDEFTLRVDLLSIRAGKRQERPVGVRVIEARSRRLRQSRGDLYVLIEGTHGCGVPEALHDELVAAITDVYHRTRGSLTRGLRAALLEANSLLFERNLRAGNVQQIRAGVNCVAVRDVDVYIGQLGPALVSLVREHQLLRYPEDSIWLTSESPSAFDLNREPAAGMRRDVEPDLYHTTLSSGDVLLLSTTSLARLAPETGVIDAITRASGESVRDGLLVLAGTQDLTAIIIECVGEHEPTALVQRAPVPQEAGAPSPTAEPETGPSEVEVGHEIQRELPVGVDAGPPWLTSSDQYPQEGDVVPVEEEEEGRGDIADLGEVISPKAGEPLIDLGDLRESLTQGAERVRRTTEEFLMQVLPDKLPERPQVEEKPRRDISLSGRALVAVALAIPLVMLFIIVMTRIQYERTRQERFSSLQALTQWRYDAAVKMEDPARKREGLRDALALIEEGLAINSADEPLNDLERRVLHKLDEVDVVERLYHFWKLVDLEDGGTSPTDSSRIVIHDIDVFILNRGSDRVYKFLLNDVGDALQSVDKDPILIRKGESLAGVLLGDMVDIAWLAAGGQRTLSTFVILERAGSLLAYDPHQGIDVLPVADSDIWLKPQAIGGYYGNLYVLDPLLGRILKYIPTDNAYTNPPGDYLSPRLDVDLTGAVDMAIDGSVYVLFADGQIRKFLRGEPQSFTMAGLPTAMRSPTTLFVSGPQKPEGEGYIYVTDTGNERILQFDKSGNYVRQFRAKPGELQMKGLRGVHVDEETGRMLILSGKALWLANAPSLGS